MTAPYPGTTKLTTHVDASDHNAITKHLHHGQPTELYRTITKCLADMFRNGNKKEVLSWLYSGGELILKHRVED